MLTFMSSNGKVLLEEFKKNKKGAATTSIVENLPEMIYKELLENRAHLLTENQVKFVDKEYEHMLEIGLHMKFYPRFREQYKQVKKENWQWEPTKG